MKISLITVCYNRRGTIRGAIESALAQDYDDIEYIIVDGASTDGTIEVINEYRDRITTIISEPDKGMYDALNKGVMAATGEVIGMIHSDDLLLDNHVVSDYAEAFLRSGADLVYANGLFVDADNTQRVIRNWIGGTYHRWKVAMGWLPLHTTCFIRRDVMMRLGLYDISYKIASDTDLLVRYLYKNRLKIEYMRRYVVRMRMGGMSTDRTMRKAMWREDTRIYRNHGLCPIPLKLMKMMWKVPQFIIPYKED